MTEDAKKSVMQDHDWSGEMGEKWNLYLDNFEGMIEPLTRVTLELAGLQPGEKVLDIGCGGGGTTLEIADRVGPEGKALGLDISPVLISTCRQRAQRAQAANVSFECADATSAKLPETDFDVLFSRFGVMFFDDPVAAFSNLHGMLGSQGRVAFCCWGPPPENPWVGKLSELLSRHMTLPAPDPDAPGPFAFADQEKTRGILEQAGFSNVDFIPWKGSLLLGGPGLDADAATDFAVKAFFVGDALQDQPQELCDAVLADVRELFHQHQTADGIELEAMSWLVSAKA